VGIYQVGGLPGGYILPICPGMYTLVYALLPPFVGRRRGLCAVCTRPPCVCTDPCVYRFYTFDQNVEEDKPLGTERCLFHPENKPCPARKPGHNGRETRHRKHCCTRTAGIPQPLSK